jgi:hypothetical protein
MRPSHYAFGLKRSELVDGILIPKFYDPELATAVAEAQDLFETPELGELLLQGDSGSRLGTWVPREEYGGGEIPYVRTSDISHWRIRPDFKKGVSRQVFEKVARRQDVATGDLLMVAHGTYLIGNVALVVPEDGDIVLQDHVFRLRVAPATGVDVHLLLAALSSGFVKRQVRSRQFSADIIDKIGERHLGIRVPIPRRQSDRDICVKRVKSILDQQTSIRSEMRVATQSDMKMVKERSATRLGFGVQFSSLRNRIVLPKYYDPALEADIQSAASSEPWTSIRELVEAGQIAVDSGVEVGKLAYGTGSIPFIRTSDLVDWEIKLDVRHGVSQQIFDEFALNGSVKDGDVLLVRDGTYLVGTSAIVDAESTPALFCGGLLRIRVVSGMNRFALLAVLNLPLVRRQLRARQFSRDVIDTLGKRFLEVRIPEPSGRTAAKVGSAVERIFARKSQVRRQIQGVCAAAAPPQKPRYDRPGWSMR